MKITVDKDNVKIEEFDIVHEGEHRVNKCSFSFSEEYTEELVKKAIFTSQNSSIEVAIINNECDIPTEILKARNIVLLGVYAYKVVDDKLDFRYSASPDAFKVNSGSYIEGASESEEITPSQFEQYMQALNDGLNKVEESLKKMDSATSSATQLVDDINQKLENGDFIGPEGPQGVTGPNGKDGVGITTITSGQSSVEGGKTITPITVNKTDGSSESFNVEAKNGQDGQNGKDGKDGANGQDGLTPSIGENGNWFIGDTDTGKPSRGKVGPSPDLSDYVKNTDYANASKAGVLKINGNAARISSDGVLSAAEVSEEQYKTTVNSIFISKGTLDNIKNFLVESSTPVITLNNTLDNLVRKNRVSDYIISLKDALKYKVFEFLVHGKVKQETTKGYNLLPYPYPSENKTQNGITFTVNIDGSVTLNGTSTGFSSFQIYAGVGLNQALEIPGNYISGGNSKAQIGIYHNIDNTDYPQLALNNSGFTEIDKSTYNTGYIEIRVNSGLTFNNETIFPMLSNEQNIPWEPYTGGQPSPSPDYPQPITTLTFDKITRCGKNLFDVNDTSAISDSVSIDDDGWINVNIDNSSGTNTKFVNVWTYPKYNIKVNTSYKLVLEIKSHSGNNGYLSPVSNDHSSYSQFNNQYQYFFYNIVDNSISVYDILSQKSFDKAKTMLRTFVSCYAGEKLQITFRISVIEDTSVTPQNFVYEPYQATEYAIDLQGNEMVELPNGVKNDLITDKYGNVSLIKNVGKVIFDGSDDEDWTFDTVSDGTNIRQFHILFENIYYNHVYYKITVLSNYFQGVPWDSSWLKNNTVTPYKYGDRVGLRLYSDNFEDLNAFKVWLSTHNVIVYYQLATPEVIPLGNLTDLITTEEGINNFFINGNLETTLEVLYARDSEKYLQQYIDDKLATLSQAIIEEG